MPFNPCIVIPCFNHGKDAVSMLHSLKKYRLKCIVVDDGSETDTAQLLDQAASENPLIHILHKSSNTGKGGAVISGLQVASNLGFSHALQIDADGQHDTEDITEMLELAKNNQLDIVCGQPRYDESAPIGRYIARHITHFWVGVETLSFDPPDTMCGFRVYPLEQTLSVIRESFIGKGMDFDIEILVRLIWRNLNIIRVPTRVIYHADGLSNFDYFKDNFQISIMHTRLVLLMLVRSPWLIINRLRSRSRFKHWSTISERGSRSGMSVLLWIYRKMGRSIFDFCLYFVIGYFFVTSKSARKASLDFLTRAYNMGSPHPKLKKAPGLKSSFFHFMEFGRSALDRVASWLGDIRREDLVFPARPKFDALAASGSGGIVFTSHLGNIEVCRALADGQEGRILNVLIFTDHAKKYNDIVKNINPNFEDRVIQISQLGPDTAIILKQMVEAGEIVVIVGDRTSVQSVGRSQAVSFMGDEALFSEGPFILASLMECPVYLMFCIFENGRYHVYFEPFAERIELPRKTRETKINNIIQSYAKRLEYYCLKQPFQWFNFYNYWDKPPSRTGDT